MKTKITTYTIGALIILSSCSIQKESAKKKEKIVDKKDLVTETFRTITERFEGEELNTDILPVSERQKDALGNLKEFFTTQKQGNLKKVIHYKKDGNVSVQVKQFDLKRVIQESVKTEDKGTTTNETKEKENLKKESVSGSLFIWIAFAVFGLYILIKEYNGFRKRKTI